MKAVHIPRGTCRLFGAIKALGTLKRCAILVHGPKGCVYHINYILGMRGDRPSQVFSTCLEEHDVIFGAEDHLREAIEELDASHSYDLIAVLSCCASSIIGEDVASAASEAQTNARVIGIAAGGFEGDFRQGHRDTLRILVELAVDSKDIIPRSANLIGVLRSGPDLRELIHILKRMGITVITVLPAGASLPEIERMGSAALNIVLCESSGKEAAERLHERFGTPYLVLDLPIGQRAMNQFCKAIAEAMSIPVPADSSMGAFETPIPPLKKIALIGGPTRAIAFTQFLKEIGVEPELIVLDFDPETSIRLQEMTGCEVLIEPDQDLIIRKLQEHQIDLIFGGMLERSLASMLGIEHFDMMHGSQKTVGEEGQRTLMHILHRNTQK